MPPLYLKSIASQLLCGVEVWIFSDSRPFCELIAAALEPFLVGAVCQGVRSVVGEFDGQLGGSGALLQVFSLEKGQIDELLEKSKKVNTNTTLSVIFSKKIIEFLSTNEFIPCLSELYSAKEEPSVFCISRKLECVLRKLALDYLFEERPKKGLEAAAYDNLNRLVNGASKVT